MFDFFKKKKNKKDIEYLDETNKTEDEDNASDQAEDNEEVVNEAAISNEEKLMDEEACDDTPADLESDVSDETVELQENDEKKSLSFFDKLKAGLSKTKKNLTGQIEGIVFRHKKIDDEFLEELEEILITSDMGMETTMDIIDYIKAETRKRKLEDTSKIKDVIKEYLVNMLEEHEEKEELKDRQRVILIVGVNGVGKTTSIGKISYRLKEQGNSVIVAAADTFRAAAVEQLKEWCTRAGVDIIASEHGSDPGAVVFDAIQAAKARKTDILICDTAGRLHNKKNLMNELSKIFKIVDREYSGAKIDVYLVIDATTGQNGIIQAKLFSETANISGLILTKLDGTAKGGIAFPIVNELKIPIKYIGVGEKIDDLQDFNATDFVNAIFE
ncbi:MULTISPECIES: signal recognition particle-docking protein FtsY [unclassified Sedimentibacter]|uniref:signal recognition particle-docking protein FtsY n=1 Tax=unclassified Sedimentibacter TaxID=2649220 RepID=UPI0027DF93D6|nr:signal recognition particle-docking protein FtsY [Sedimentibacter sp. MB35-C1]WMJ76295.1 signal recognition particle-docking protein FtsY [Sedimentibacter sp. MB35-C1]